MVAVEVMVAAVVEVTAVAMVAAVLEVTAVVMEAAVAVVTAEVMLAAVVEETAAAIAATMARGMIVVMTVRGMPWVMITVMARPPLRRLIPLGCRA